MKNRLLFTLIALLTCVFSKSMATDHAPYFNGGHSQTLSACQNASGVAVNSLLAVMDSDASQTETWSAVATPGHGTCAVAYTTTSTGSLLTPSGLTYTPATGYHGNDTFAVMVSDGALADTTYIYVTVNALPDTGIITGASFVCVGTTTTLADTISGGIWGLTNGNAAISAGGVVTGVTPGTDTVRYFVINTCGTAIATRTISIDPNPAAGTITGAASLCIGATDTLTTSASGGTWRATNSNASIAAGVVTGAAAGTDSIVYTITNACGSASAYFLVTVNTTPVAGTISGATTVCTGITDTLAESVSGGIWSATNANASVVAGVATGVAAGNDTIVYIVSTTCGTAVARYPITINASANAGTISGASSVCTAASATYTASVSGGVWSITNSHAAQVDSMITGTTTGFDTIRYGVTNSCGTTYATFPVNIITRPHAGPITGSPRICVGGTAALSAPTTGGTWTVSNGNATISGDTLTGALYGHDTVTYIATNACGTDTAHFAVSIDTAAPHLAAITGRTNLCVGDTTHYYNTTPGGLWTMSNTSLATITLHEAKVRALAIGSDTVIYTLTNGCGTAVATYSITIYPAAPVGVINGYDSVCAGLHIHLTATGTGGTWASSNSLFASVDTAGNVTGNLHGTATIFYIVSSACGLDSARRKVNVNVPVQPIIGQDTICRNPTAPVTFIDNSPYGTWSSSNLLVAGVVPFLGGEVFGISVGSAYVKYTVHNACGTSADSILVNVVNCGTEVATTATASAQLSITPNPTSGHLTLYVPGTASTRATVVITDILGRKIQEFQVAPGQEQEIDLDAPNGMYVVTACSGGKKYTDKLIINK